MLNKKVMSSLDSTNTPLMKHIYRIHFIGVGGAGMCGIAEVMFRLGYEISGSDLQSTKTTQHLAKLGIKIFVNHCAEYINDVDVVVMSAAVSHDNIEVSSAREKGIMVISRAELLSELMRYRYGIAVSGTHGKTTTTSLISSVMQYGKLDPTFIIGGCLHSINANALLGQSQYLVVEADESDGSFLFLRPMIAVVTNIDADHLSAYEGDFLKLQQAFIQFLHNTPFYGVVILCVDCPVVRQLLPKIKRKVITYGCHESADYRAVNIHYNHATTHFSVCKKNNSFRHPITINLPGRHNIQNALAAFVVSSYEDLPSNIIANGLKSFLGVHRRFQVLPPVHIAGDEIMLIDDYGHHPTEIKATISAIRNGWSHCRLVMVYQPHRYTRMRDLYEEFVSVLAGVDLLFLMNVYSAGEPPIAGYDSYELAKKMNAISRTHSIVVNTFAELKGHISTFLHKNDVLLMQGAGDISEMSSKLSGQYIDRDSC